MLTHIRRFLRTPTLRRVRHTLVALVVPIALSISYVKTLFRIGPVNFFKGLSGSRKGRFDHLLSIVAIVRNEGAYLKEWIDYHKLIGVSKFYIYDNESDDNTKEVLSGYIKSGDVEYIWYPGRRRQKKAYRDAVIRYRFCTKWLAVIDLDEFIFPVGCVSSVCAI